MSADGGQLTVSDRRASVRVVQDPIPVLDTGRFEHMQRIASVMAATSMVPDALRMGKNDAGQLEALPAHVVLANCFLVVNQATRWGMDPFAVAQCVSIVHGKLTYEGKLVAAVLDAKLGVQLTYAWKGEGERMSIAVSGTLPDGRVETIEGSVGEWKTSGKNSPWSPGNYRKMLAYRGAREWARLHAPAVMLGVYSPDEMDALARPMRDVTPSTSAPPPAPQIGVALPPSAPPQAPPALAPQAGPPSPPKGPPSPPGPALPTAAVIVDPPLAGDALLAHIADELGACGDQPTLDETWDGFEELLDRLSRADRERAGDLYTEHSARVAG